MHDREAMVYLIDDDLRIHQALTALFSSAGRALKTFLDPDEFFAFKRPDVPACLILDLQLPGTTGLEVQAKLSAGRMPPTIFLTGKGDIPSTVKAMKAGAVEFLEKPFDADDLFAAVDAAILKDIASRTQRQAASDVTACYSRLTPKEREVLPFVVSGLLSKQAAGILGTSEVTIRVHRGNIMRKMKADSLADLVRLTEQLAISPRKV